MKQLGNWRDNGYWGWSRGLKRSFVCALVLWDVVWEFAQMH